MIEHKNISGGNRHGLENWIVQNETELNALEVDSLDVGKVAYKSDDNSYWRLKSTTLWVRITIIYSVGDGGLTEINFTTARKNKLDGLIVEDGGLTEINFTTARRDKLLNIESEAQKNDINTTLQGNTFNGVGQLVKLDASGKLPAIDASQLTNFPLTDISSKLNKTNPAIVGSITETVYNLTGTLINPSNGTIQYKTLSANTTFTESLTAGQSVTLRIAGGDTFTVAYPTITWVGGTAPVLTANDVIVFWKESTVLYGAYIGSLV